MNVAKLIAVAAVAALALAGPNPAPAQMRPVQAQAQARMGSPAEPPGCEKVVKDYVNAMRFIKEASGAGIAGRLEQAYLNEAEIAQIAAQQGPCAAVQALRNKGAAVR